MAKTNPTTEEVVEPVAETSALKPYKVLTPLLHNEVNYSIDSVVELSEGEASKLIALSVIEAAEGIRNEIA